MKLLACCCLTPILIAVSLAIGVGQPPDPTSDDVETSAGWVKCNDNPVLGGNYGTCFDIAVLKDGDQFRMWFSWRPQNSIALVESLDGIHWSEPEIVLGPNDATDWEDDLNRPVVLKKDDTYHLWYTGFNKQGSFIGYATSSDGKAWKRMSAQPVLRPEQPWEKQCVMCPHVTDDAGVFKMWYSAGERNEPNAIGYAVSADGLHWTKHAANPIFAPNKSLAWEQHKVTACQVLKQGDWYLMFYIGFRDEPTAHIGIARSKDGITDWQRHPANPIVWPSKNGWDASACYKPYAILDGNRWFLWYNGRHDMLEQIGLVTHDGADLGFDQPSPTGSRNGCILTSDKLRRYVDDFNSNDQELYSQYVSNDQAMQFLQENVPLFDCPDKDIEQTYYFRWWTYRKHLKHTPDGFVITEFLPQVSWSGKHNTISCAAGHHLYEGRWLRNPKFLDDYSTFWFRRGGEPRHYSFWAADALGARFLVDKNSQLIADLLPDLIRNYEAWEKDHCDANGLFWQTDDRDGMETSIGGRGYRATINSYMYGDAAAIAELAALTGQPDLAKTYREKAAKLKQLVEESLWDRDAEFFKVLPRTNDAKPVDVCELHGYTPWYFNLPDADKSAAWKRLTDPDGFHAAFGPTTAEQRHPQFTISYANHECQWNGPSWPYATSVTLTAMANLLNHYRQDYVGRNDYFDLLKIYAKSHRLTKDDGTVVPWIDENLNPQTGDWISRTRLSTWKDGTWDASKGGVERGKDYNHSTFCDLIITGLVGLRPRADDTIEVNPLLPDDAWDWVCLDGVPYHGHTVTILFDRSGNHYKLGKGLRVIVDGQLVAQSCALTRLTAQLP